MGTGAGGRLASKHPACDAANKTGGRRLGSSSACCVLLVRQLQKLCARGKVFQREKSFTQQKRLSKDITGLCVTFSQGSYAAKCAALFRDLNFILLSCKYQQVPTFHGST